jgi:RecJ-like exonuclease
VVTCYDCVGKGYQVFLDRETHCKPCNGEGELLVCSSYVLTPGALVVFRNQRCHNCGVKESDHVTSEVPAN